MGPASLMETFSLGRPESHADGLCFAVISKLENHTYLLSFCCCLPETDMPCVAAVSLKGTGHCLAHGVLPDPVTGAVVMGWSSVIFQNTHEGRQHRGFNSWKYPAEQRAFLLTTTSSWLHIHHFLIFCLIFFFRVTPYFRWKTSNHHQNGQIRLWKQFRQVPDRQVLFEEAWCTNGLRDIHQMPSVCVPTCSIVGTHSDFSEHSTNEPPKSTILFNDAVHDNLPLLIFSDDLHPELSGDKTQVRILRVVLLGHDT